MTSGNRPGRRSGACTLPGRIRLSISMVVATAFALAFAPCAMPEPARPHDAHADWYKIEIIVFENTSVPESGEHFEAAQPHYPANVLSVLPESDDLISPMSREQAKEVIGIIETVDAPDAPEASRESFVFESRSRFQPGPDDTAEAQDLPAAPDARDAEATDIILARRVEAFRELPASARHLAAEAQRIRRSSRYRLLLHTAWAQPLPEGAEALPVLIHTPSKFLHASPLEGVVSVSRTRYLHLSTDLWLNELPEAESVSGPSVLGQESDLSKTYPTLPISESLPAWHQPPRHRLTQSRRMRSGTLHFVDHPNFGLLVQIDRYTPQLADEMPE